MADQCYRGLFWYAGSLIWRCCFDEQLSPLLLFIGLGHPVVPQFINDSPLPPMFPLTLKEETWLRGAWPTDENGVAQFTSMLAPSRSLSASLTIIFEAIFPGYYQGRATHIHAKVFPEWKVLENNTFMSSRVVHVGQFFFDDEINMVVDKVCVCRSIQ
jgi:hypothetical protein